MTPGNIIAGLAFGLFILWLAYELIRAPDETEMWPPEGEPVSFVADTPHDRKRGES